MVAVQLAFRELRTIRRLHRIGVRGELVKAIPVPSWSTATQFIGVWTPTIEKTQISIYLDWINSLGAGAKPESTDHEVPHLTKTFGRLPTHEGCASHGVQQLGHRSSTTAFRVSRSFSEAQISSKDCFLRLPIISFHIEHG